MTEEITVMVFWTTRQEMDRTFAAIRRRWAKVSRCLDSGEGDARFARRAMAAMQREARRWSAPRDWARVDVDECRDIKCLCLAVEKAMPRAARTLERLEAIADASAHGYWSGGAGDTETYRRTPDGWEMVADDAEEEEP